jgi:hypothetical protein
LPEREAKENPGFDGPKKNDPPKGTPSPGLDIIGVWLADDLYTADGIGWERLSVTK